MTYAEVRALTVGCKVRHCAGGPAALVYGVTENFIRLEWYDGKAWSYDILGKLSPMWATMKQELTT